MFTTASHALCSKPFPQKLLWVHKLGSESPQALPLQCRYATQHRTMYLSSVLTCVAHEQAAEMQHVTQRNLSMLSSMLHAAHLQHQLIGNYLAQYQQQAMLNLAGPEHPQPPPRIPQMQSLQHNMVDMSHHLDQPHDSGQQSSVYSKS